MKTTKTLFTAILLIMFSLASFAQLDTIYINGTDTFDTWPTGWRATSSEYVVNTYLEDSVYFNEQKIMTNVETSTMTTTFDSTTVDVRLWIQGNDNLPGKPLLTLNNDTLYFVDPIMTPTLDTTFNVNDVNSNSTVFVSLKSGALRYDVSFTTYFEKKDTTGFIIYVEPFASVSENRIVDDFNIFPNPTANYLNFNTILNTNYLILNTNGQVIQNGFTNNRVDVTDLPKGFYFLKVNEVIKPFIKQ
jgi:hypothetical protein